MNSYRTPGQARLATITAAAADARVRRLTGKVLRLFRALPTVAPATTEGCRAALHAVGLALIRQPTPMALGERGGVTVGLADHDRYRGADTLDARLLCGAIAAHTCMEAA